MELERLNSNQFERFRDFIYKKSGIRIDEHKVTLLSNRIRRRLQAGDFEDFDVYYQFLTSRDGVGELEGFLDAITTNETFFFRTENHFQWLKTDFLRDMIALHQSGKRPASIRVWSAGCASGAEPYSIAICLAENKYRLNEWSLQILGSDISEEMLRAARRGTYRPRAVETATDHQLRRFFRHQPDSDVWEVRPQLKQLVDFTRHNLMEPSPGKDFDCIFIRNVLIYFDRESKGVVVKHLINALAPGGYLVTGPSEGVYDMLKGMRKVSTFVYQKEVRC